MAAALIALMLAAAAPSPGFAAFEEVCMAPEADPGKVAQAATAVGFAPEPQRSDRFSGPAGVVTLSKGAQKDVKDLGGITLSMCTLTLPGFAQADVDGLWRWMGHTGSKTDGQIGAFVIVEAGRTPHEMAFNRPDKAQVALRNGRLRLVSAEKVGSGLRLLYAVVSPGAER